MESFTLPKASPAPLPELAAYLAPFAPLFRRAQSRESLERYVTGLLNDLPRKDCDTIAVAGASTERLQHLLADADWHPEQLDEARVRRLAAVSPPAGILALDDTGLPKQCKRSVGCSRSTVAPWARSPIVKCGERPVRGRCARLVLPERWAADPGRRDRAHVPEAVAFPTKPQVALTLVDRARRWTVPFRDVVADAGYGDNPTFLAGLEERQLWYVCAVERTFGVRLPAEVREAAAAAPSPTPGSSSSPSLLPTLAARTSSVPPNASSPIPGRASHELGNALYRY
jgi:SRSO17 transposase